MMVPEVDAAQPVTVTPEPRPPSSGSSEVDTLLSRAQIAMSQRRWDEAATLCKAALALSPQNRAANDWLVRTYAAWGIDYLKYDWCGARNLYTDEEMQAVYQIMGDALLKAKRPIVYSLCQYGMGDVWKWGAEVGGWDRVETPSSRGWARWAAAGNQVVPIIG